MNSLIAADPRIQADSGGQAHHVPQDQDGRWAGGRFQRDTGAVPVEQRRNDIHVICTDGIPAWHC
jgi:hypothetical protein